MQPGTRQATHSNLEHRARRPRYAAQVDARRTFMPAAMQAGSGVWVSSREVPSPAVPLWFSHSKTSMSPLLGVRGLVGGEETGRLGVQEGFR